MGTRRRAQALALLLVVVVVAVLPGSALAEPEPEPPPVEPAPPQARYFPETGFWVDPLFASYWEANGGLMTFGYPITRAFYQDGLHRQYFERAIFEHREDATGDAWPLTLVRLGAVNTVERRWAGGELPFVPREPDPARDEGGIYFVQTGHALSATFRAYWERHGGLQTFGYPLSDEFIEPGIEDGVPRPVQYFERARFEWHQEFAGTAFEVLLGHLGREALAKREMPELAVTPQAETAAERDSPPLPPLPIGEPATPGCGFNFLFWTDSAHDATNARYLDLAAASGCQWLRLPFPWIDIEPRRGANIEDRIWPYARIVELAQQRGLRVMVTVGRPPGWARTVYPSVPADPRAFASFLSRLVAHFAGQVDAWQVWNEPNLIDENNGKIDPYGFFQLLKAAYPAIKGADPRALVVFPGLAPTSLMYDDWALDDDWYLEALLSINNGEAARYFDVLGIQAYGAGNDPDTYYPGNLADNPGWTDAPEFYFRHAEQLYGVLVSLGLEEKPVWIGEFGWPVGEHAEVYGYGRWITEELQAQYFMRALEILRTEWHWVETAFVWHLNIASFGAGASPHAGFSITNELGEPLPAYDAISQTVQGTLGE
jgi:hypothetical protein